MSIDKQHEQISQFAEMLGVTFIDINLLQQALTHSSYANQNRQNHLRDNERLEFLGDAVLKLVVSDFLYDRFPHEKEGNLTKLRARIVSDTVLAGLAKKLGVGEVIKLSYSERNTGGMHRNSNLANALEAILGAVYRDQGLEAAKSFFIRILESNGDELLNPGAVMDYKSTLQEMLQHQRQSLPVYHILKEEGPEHKKIFHVEVTFDWNGQSHHYTGAGVNKKDAEQSAARVAFQAIQND